MSCATTFDLGAPTDTIEPHGRLVVDRVILAESADYRLLRAYPTVDQRRREGRERTCHKDSLPEPRQSSRSYRSQDMRSKRKCGLSNPAIRVPSDQAAGIQSNPNLPFFIIVNTKKKTRNVVSVLVSLVSFRVAVSVYGPARMICSV